MKTVLVFLITSFYLSSWAFYNADQELLECAAIGNLACVKVAFNQGANIMATDRRQNTALHLAVENKHLEIVQLLIEEDSTPKHIMAKGNRKMTPLHIAAHRGHSKIAQFLINTLTTTEHFMTKSQWGNTPLHLALKMRHFELAQYLIDLLPSPEHIMSPADSGSPLIFAARLGDLDLAQFLLKNLPSKKYLMIRDKEAKTPLYLAAQSGKTKLIQFLIHQLPTPEHILAQAHNGDTAFERTLLFGPTRSALLIFGNSPLTIKKELLKLCYKTVPRTSTGNLYPICSTLEVSLKKPSLLNPEVYR